MTENPQFDRVKEFNECFGHAVRNTPSIRHDDIRMRFNLVMEEVEEIADALYLHEFEGMSEEDALVEVADGIADTLVTLYGFAQATGIPVTEIFDIVADSNMSKLGEDGKPVYYTDGPKKGKIAKGPNYWDPKDNIREVIRKNMSND